MNGNSSSQTIQKKELCQELRGCSGKRIEIICPKAFNKLNKWQKHFPLLCIMGVRVQSVLQHSLSLSCCCFSHTWGRMDLHIHEEDETWLCTNLHAFGSDFPLGLDGQCVISKYRIGLRVMWRDNRSRQTSNVLLFCETGKHEQSCV